MLSQLPSRRALTSVRAKSPGDGFLHTLPAAARDAGVAAFGSISAAISRRRHEVLRTLDGAVTLQLASIDGDKSVSHLRRDALGPVRDFAAGWRRRRGGRWSEPRVLRSRWRNLPANARAQHRADAADLFAPGQPSPQSRANPLAFDVYRAVTRRRASAARHRRRVHLSQRHRGDDFPVAGGDSQLAMAAQGATGSPKVASAPVGATRETAFVPRGDGRANDPAPQDRLHDGEWAALSCCAFTPPVTTPASSCASGGGRAGGGCRRASSGSSASCTSGLEPDYDFELRRKSGRPVVRPVTHLFETVRARSPRGCTLDFE